MALLTAIPGLYRGLHGDAEPVRDAAGRGGARAGLFPSRPCCRLRRLCHIAGPDVCALVTGRGALALSFSRVA